MLKFSPSAFPVLSSYWTDRGLSAGQLPTPTQRNTRMSTFDSTKLPLPQVLADITAGKIQLPDFQRGWVWDDEHIKSLLVSIARSFPIGAVMMLDAGGGIRFQVRPIENVDLPEKPPHPERLILDGQQRLTSLTQVLEIDKPVKTSNQKGNKINCHYYIDIAMALQDGRLEDAFISVPEDRKVKTNFNRDITLDLSNRKLELERFHFPCSQILNSDDWEQALHEHVPQRFSDYMKFRKSVLSAFRNYQLPVITLGKTTTKEAVCLVFEKVNTHGVPLSVFELVTATFAADGFNLRDSWFGDESDENDGIHKRLEKQPILANIDPTDFLQAVSILQTYARRQEDIKEGKKGKMASPVSAKRTAILDLDLSAYNNWASDVEKGFEGAAQFMRHQCFFDVRELPYQTQLVPLAAVLSHLDDRWREPPILDRLARWFWCGVLGELYGGAVETRIANDFEDLMRWFGLNSGGSAHVSDNELPRTISDAVFQESRLDTLKRRNSAAYKGLNVLILREGAEDWFYKAKIQVMNYEDMKLDIHHIFPRAWCKKEKIKESLYESIVNRTMISSKANKVIGSKAPSKYLTALQQKGQDGWTEKEMNSILTSHQIPCEPLRSDDFDAFYSMRKQALIKLIEKVTGKSVQRDESNQGSQSA